jgi:ATP phosphoribosyltransferase
MPTLKIGLPKGSLQNSTLELLSKAGWEFAISSRSYYPRCNDSEIEAMIARPQEMSRYVERGVMDIAIGGLDWVEENASSVEIVERLVYAKQSRKPVRWVLAVPEESSIQSVKDLEGKVISTELVEVTKRYLKKNNVNATVEFSHGATEVKVPHLADAIVDVTETGSSLRANKLRIVESIQESVTVVMANKNALKDEFKKSKIDAICMMLKGALDAKQKVLLKLNVGKDNLDAIVEKLPSLHSPTVNHLADDKWVAVETIVDQDVTRELIPELKAGGAEGIIELSLNNMIP